MYQLSADQIRSTLLAARDRRTNAPAHETQIDALRLLNGIGDGAPRGLTIDRYSGWLVISAREQLGDETARAWANAAIELFGGEGAVLKRLARSAQESTSEVIAVALPSAPLVVRE